MNGNDMLFTDYNLHRKQVRIINIYHMNKSEKHNYQWNEQARKTAGGYIVKQRIGYAVGLILLAVMIWHMMTTNVFTASAYVGWFFCLAILLFGYIQMLNSMSRKRSLKMPPEERHDYALLFYYFQKGKNLLVTNIYLLGCAETDIYLQRYELAQQALDEIHMEKCKADQLKKIWLLRMIIALSEKNEQEAQEAFIRYTGITHTVNPFPADEIVQDCLDAGDTLALTEAMKKCVKVKKEHPVRIAIMAIVIAYIIGFWSMISGINSAAGYELRYTFQMMTQTVTLFCMIVVIIWSISSILKKKKGIVFKAGFIIVEIILLVIMLFINGILYLYESERKVEEKVSEDENYTYLRVYSEDGYNNQTSVIYRAKNPFIMQKGTLITPEKTGNVYENTDSSEDSTSDSEQSSSDIASDGSVDQSQSAQNSGNSVSTDTTNTSEDITAVRDAEKEYHMLQDQMKAVHEYLKSEGQFTDSEISFDANAKGETYALIGSGQEQMGTRQVDVEYRLYCNYSGEKTDDTGTTCVEIVLEKFYPSGSYSTELVDFYLVNPNTLQVTDEHKSTW